jgi:hypothetical protein
MAEVVIHERGQERLASVRHARGGMNSSGVVVVFVITGEFVEPRMRMGGRRAAYQMLGTLLCRQHMTYASRARC